MKVRKAKRSEIVNKKTSRTGEEKSIRAYALYPKIIQN
jgi:hypothetical protein